MTCQSLREQQNVYHPEDCTRDVHHGVCGRGARGLWGWSNRNLVNSEKVKSVSVVCGV